MLRNYITVAFRNIIKAPIYFIINLLGLSIGVSACFLIIQYVHFESNFDGFHEHSDRIYRVIQSSGGGRGANTPAPVATLMASEFESIEYAVQFRRSRSILESREGQKIANKEDNILFASGDFFNVFDFPLISGETKALSQPNNIFITEETANRYFPNTDPLGKEMLLYEGNFGELRLNVAGVVRNLPENTNVPFESVVSMTSLENNNQPWAKFDNWGWSDFYTFVRLYAGKTITAPQTVAFLDKYIGEQARVQGQVEVDIQPIKDIRLNATLANEYFVTKDKNIISFLLLVAVFILTMACINYINLTTAKGFERAKEVGVRKNLGATRKNIIGQFSLEALIINISSLLVAITAVQLLQPILTNTVGGAFENDLWDTPGIFLMGLVPFSIGLVWSVLQPAWLISSFSMVAILKGKVINHGTGLIYRKWSVLFQFMISLTLMVSSFIIYNQVQYLQNKDLGMNIDHLLVVERPMQSVSNYGDKARIFADNLRNLTDINGVSISGRVPSQGFNFSTNSVYKKGDDPTGLGDNGLAVTYVDDQYVEIYDMKMAAGTYKYNGSDSRNKVLLNESALKTLDFTNAEEAIGAVLMIRGDKPENEHTVIGVVKDYNHGTAKSRYQATLFFVTQNANYFTISYNSGDNPLKSTKRVLEAVKSDYDKTFPDNTFNYFFMDEKFEESYKSELNFGQIMLMFTGLAVLLACLGLFGLSLFNLSNKTKEMGVRKVLGATSFSLLIYTSKDFIKLIALASLPALPLAFYLANIWLSDYPFKVDITWVSFLIPTLGLMIIALLTTLYHLTKLSGTNPVDSLRYE